MAAVLSIGVRIPQETVIERMAGSNPVLTTAQFILVILGSADTKTKIKITK